MRSSTLASTRLRPSLGGWGSTPRPLGVVGPLLLLVGPIAGIFTAIAAAGGIAAIAVAAFGTVVAIATSPIALIIVAVLALAAAAYMIYKHWDGIAAFFGDLWRTLKDTT